MKTLRVRADDVGSYAFANMKSLEKLYYSGPSQYERAYDPRFYSKLWMEGPERIFANSGKDGGKGLTVYHRFGTFTLEMAKANEYGDPVTCWYKEQKAIRDYFTGIGISPQATLVRDWSTAI